MVVIRVEVSVGLKSAEWSVLDGLGANVGRVAVSRLVRHGAWREVSAGLAAMVHPRRIGGSNPLSTVQARHTTQDEGSQMRQGKSELAQTGSASAGTLFLCPTEPHTHALAHRGRRA